MCLRVIRKNKEEKKKVKNKEKSTSFWNQKLNQLGKKSQDEENKMEGHKKECNLPNSLS